MKEIGGFFELELPRGTPRHGQAIHLNSARNCIRYLVRAHQIKKIHVPAFTCPVVWDALHDENCEIEFYSVGSDFLPEQAMDSDSWVLYTNYFGVCDARVAEMARRYPKLIVDQAQAFYAPATENCLYSPRKFFGLSDGGLLYTSKELTQTLETGVSVHRMSHLLRRVEEGASPAYEDFRQNDGSLDHEPVMEMSRLTRRMLEGISYEQAAQRRQENFAYLHGHLGKQNELSLDPDSFAVPMVYPCLNTRSGAAWKKKLIEQKIYVATYWPGQQDAGFGKTMEQSMLALPIDQRYTTKDMERILEVLDE